MSEPTELLVNIIADETTPEDRPVALVGSGKAHNLMAMAAMMGVDIGAAIDAAADVDMKPPPTWEDGRSEFARQSDEYKDLCRPHIKYPQSSRPYVKPLAPGEIKGKAARKAAKRARHAAMKAQEIKA